MDVRFFASNCASIVSKSDYQSRAIQTDAPHTTIASEYSSSYSRASTARAVTARDQLELIADQLELLARAAARPARAVRERVQLELLARSRVQLELLARLAQLELFASDNSSSYSLASTARAAIARTS